MDIRDIKREIPEQYLEGNLFKNVWKLQEELLQRYIEIEGLPQYPVDLSTRANQNLIKDFIGRVVEEMAEAVEQLQVKGEPYLFLEELVDGLHFLMEIFIYSYESADQAVSDCKIPDLLQLLPDEVEPSGPLMGKDRVPNTNNIKLQVWEVVYQLNLARNALRNKDWKQTQIFPIMDTYYARLHLAFGALMWIFEGIGLDPGQVINAYWKKNQINRFRINSKY